MPRPALRLTLFVLCLLLLSLPLVGILPPYPAYSQGTASSTIITSTTQSYVGTAYLTESIRATDAGYLNQARSRHTATRLLDGTVLLVGGRSSDEQWDSWQASAERYDPQTGTFSPVGSMSVARDDSQTATLLADGRVLVVGGSTASWDLPDRAEVYDPITERFTPVGTLQRRNGFTTTLLPDGRVLVLGGIGTGGWLRTAELFDPARGVFTPTGSMSVTRWRHTATLLPNGKVLVAGGDDGQTMFASAELYDPASGTFESAGTMTGAHFEASAMVLPEGQVLIVGGRTDSGEFSRFIERYDPETGQFTRAGSTELVYLRPHLAFLPEGRVLIFGTDVSLPRAELYDPVEQKSTGSMIWRCCLTGEEGYWWLGVGFTATSLDNGQVLVAGGGKDGNPIPEEKLLSYRAPAVLTGTLTLPVEASSGPFVVALSGMGSPFRATAAALAINNSSPGSWIPITDGQPVTTTLTMRGVVGAQEVDLILRNAEGQIRQVVSGTTTIVDRDPPRGLEILINQGALATTSEEVMVKLRASDNDTLLAGRLQAEGQGWGSWFSYRDYYDQGVVRDYRLSPGVGSRTVYAQFQDLAGNLSEPISTSIRLDTAAGTAQLMSINEGALFTNQAWVPLRVGAPAGTSEMQLSNDGGFDGAQWQPFDTRPMWTISTYGSYVIPRTVYVRVRDRRGDVSAAYSDDIIYDPVPPTGQVQIVGASANSLQVRLEASDPENISGVSAMRVALAATFTRSAWEPFATSKVLPLPGGAEPLVYAQFRDGAGNVSGAVCATTGAAPCIALLPRLYLPLTRR